MLRIDCVERARTTRMVFSLLCRPCMCVLTKDGCDSSLAYRALKLPLKPTSASHQPRPVKPGWHGTTARRLVITQGAHFCFGLESGIGILFGGTYEKLDFCVHDGRGQVLVLPVIVRWSMRRLRPLQTTPPTTSRTEGCCGSSCSRGPWRGNFDSIGSMMTTMMSKRNFVI